jgi:aryl-alcohol dehydrogenase-like predicted oxidoreductase
MLFHFNTSAHQDLYMIHRPSPDTDIEETLSAQTDLLRAGKLRSTTQMGSEGSRQPSLAGDDAR